MGMSQRAAGDTTQGPPCADVILVDLGSGEVVGVGEQLTRWSGYEVQDLVGSPLWDTVAGGVLGDLLRLGHDDPATAAVLPVVAGEMVARDGATREVRWAQTVLRDADGRPAHLVMTELVPEAIDDDLRALDEVTEAQEGTLERVTRGLLENLSHELRTPVASVSGYVELLREGEGGELTMMQRKFVGAIARSSERLRALTDQLVVIAGLGQRDAQLRREPLDLRDVVSSVRVSVATSGVERVTVALEPGEDRVVVAGDRDRLVQAVEELVANAAKFTLGTGHVTCSLRTEEGQAVLEVADDGLGFDDAESGSLFLPFYRSEGARLRAVPGAGLGLTVVAAVVHGHGGGIVATSEAEHGSTFTIRLPLVDLGVDATRPGDEAEWRRAGEERVEAPAV